MMAERNAPRGVAAPDAWNEERGYRSVVQGAAVDRDPEQTMQTVEAFEAHRPLLFGIAYRMLGSAADAEDIVQEAYLRYQATPPDTIREPRAFLSTIVTRICLDQLKSARARRETYVGPWLPEPLATPDLTASEGPAERVSLAESISLAFLVLLESLTPAERAVFLLHEVFDYSFTEIAPIVERSEATCRQLFHRARQHLIARRPRFAAPPDAQQRLTASFLRAAGSGDLPGLVELLAEDVTLWSDGGGKVQAARNPIHGADAVSRLLLGIMRKAPPDMRVEPAVLNGEQGLLAYTGGRVFGALVLETDGARIHGIRFIVNPDKLTRLQMA